MRLEAVHIFQVSVVTYFKVPLARVNLKGVGEKW